MKNKFQNLCILGLAAAVFAGCSANAASEKVTTEDVFKIGVVQYVEHQSLDDIYKGIVDELKANGYEDGINIEIDYQNGQGDQSNLKTISSKFVNDNSDLIIAIATPAAQTVASETSEIPIIGASITDMVSAGLVENPENPGGNITGISDMAPVEEQIDILLQLVPDAKSIGISYCTNEVNSEVQVNKAIEYLKSKGIEPVITTVTNSNDVLQAISSLAGKVDGLYIPVDNTMASAMPTISSVCTENKLPIITGAAVMVEQGAVATSSFDYYDSGKQAGKMAIRILEGENPANMPVEFTEETKIYVNKTFADSIGIEVPENLIKSAYEVY